MGPFSPTPVELFGQLKKLNHDGNAIDVDNNLYIYIYNFRKKQRNEAKIPSRECNSL